MIYSYIVSFYNVILLYYDGVNVAIDIFVILSPAFNDVVNPAVIVIVIFVLGVIACVIVKINIFLVLSVVYDVGVVE